MLNNILFINIFSIIIILILYNISLYNNKSYNMSYIIKRISYITTILLILNIDYIYYQYNSNYIEYQYIVNILGIYWGLDSISLVLLLMVHILLPICLLSNWNNINNNKIIIYCILILILGLFLILNFICLDIISFYILFESTLPPLFILIGIYGSYNSIRASYYLFIYTLFSSLFMLIGIIFIYYLTNNNYYSIIDNYIINIDIQCILYILLMIGIIVKIPLWPIHSWLPLAHSESPIGGSILLAGIILKISIYAIIRILLPVTFNAILLYLPFIYTLCIITIIYIGIITIRQYDLKVIIAYSSIGHMAICLISILSNNIIGINGSILLSLSHGFVSPALFIIVGGILYDRYHNRLLYYYQGLSTYMPILSIYLLLFSLSNIGLPLTGNFIGELLSLIGSYKSNPILIILASISILISAIYQMRMTTKLLGGYKSNYMNITIDINNRELYMLNILLIPVLIIGIKPICLTHLMDINISSLIYNI